MENTKTPMKDKETKDLKEILVTLSTATLDGWYGLLFGMNRKSKERYVLIKVKDLEKIFDGFSKIEQEAERRGAIKTCKEIYNYVEAESGISGRREILQYIAELKLLGED